MKKKIVRNIIITLIAALVVYYFMLPPINFKATEFYVFIIIVLAIFTVLTGMSMGQQAFHKSESLKFVSFGELGKGLKVILGIIGLCAVILIGGSIISASFFHAKSYQSLMNVEDRAFAEDINQISLKEVPIVDRDTAIRLGNRKLGELVDLVSQFEVDESSYSYTQINYNGVPTRVAPMEYGDFIKWFNNRNQGIPGYMSVNMTNQEVTLTRLEEGIKYSPGEYLFRKLERQLRIQYPTKMFDDYSFEVDDEGNPYWICPVYDYTIGIFGGKDIVGVVILDAQDGSSNYYDIADVPQWVDQAYSSDLVVEQIDYWGKYKQGFFNSVIGQREVCVTSGGYNYLALEDDVWLYTGLTSAGNDQSNIGFVLVNLRTKEARYYTVSGATEQSAMASAEGQVQHLSYNATFPVLLNIGNQPTYFLALKDNAGLVKMFAYINIEQYQTVGIGENLNEAYTSYLELVAETGEIDISTLDSVTGTIEYVQTAVKDGNTFYYIGLTNRNKVFTASIETTELLAILKEGDQVTIGFVDTDDSFVTINSIEKK